MLLPLVSQKDYTFFPREFSRSMVTRDLILEALEIQEDTVLARVAEERETTIAGRKTLSHDEVWE